MSTQVIKEEHPFATCAIVPSQGQSPFIGTLSYRGYKNGQLHGSSVDAVISQFRAICDLIDHQGGMLRLGTIMLGYHNDELKGDVLLPDGEIIGSWDTDGEDWCHFIPVGQSKPELSAPSDWMLQESIASWLERDAG